MKYKQMALADALRAKVALVLLSLGFPQNLVWQFPLSCQIFGALKLIYICIFIVYPVLFHCSQWELLIDLSNKKSETT